MPYEVAFTKLFPIPDRDPYINDCCVGGDVVVDHLLPSIRAKYEEVESNQEDWGWFIWFRKGNVGLAIDVHTDDPDKGTFRIHLTSRKKRFILSDQVADTPELEELRALVVSELEAWGASPVQTTRLDADYI